MSKAPGLSEEYMRNRTKELLDQRKQANQDVIGLIAKLKQLQSIEGLPISYDPPSLECDYSVIESSKIDIDKFESILSKCISESILPLDEPRKVQYSFHWYKFQYLHALCTYHLKEEDDISQEEIEGRLTCIQVLAEYNSNVWDHYYTLNLKLAGTDNMERDSKDSMARLSKDTSPKAIRGYVSESIKLMEDFIKLYNVVNMQLSILEIKELAS